MYLTFFGLSEKPFAITPDPRYLYLSARHADALAHLVYGINEAGGFIQLTGEVGTGKTTTIRSLLARAPKNAEIALILNPKLAPGEFLRSLCEELGLGVADADDDNTKELVDVLNRHLLRMHGRARRVVLIVDEAQDLSPEVLEQIRLLTNLETETQKLLQIILIGQPELRTLLARQDLRQLAQRITGRYHLDPLSREETAAYVRHRLRVAGATADIFSRGALREVYRVSGGIPRVINIVCDRALLGAYTQDLHEVPAGLVRRAGGEVFGRTLAPAWVPMATAAAAAVLLAASAFALWRYVPHHPLASRAVPATAATAGPAAAGAGTALTPTATAAAPPPAAATAGAAPGVAARVAPAVRPAVATSAAAAAGSAVRAQEPTARLAALLAAHRDSTDTDTAFSSLMGLWKVRYIRGNTDGCSQAVAQGLQCLARRGSLAQLTLLNRPAILMLTDERGTPYQVVLRSLSGDDVELQLGAQRARVSIADLTRYWFGDFLLLWHPAVRDAAGLALGMHGAPVQRLRSQLERWRGLAAAAQSSDRYDASLMQLVEQFQRASHLAVDGVAGIETQVALDAALAAPDSPLLQARNQPRGDTTTALTQGG
ncbi:MAG TPA: AAA family ATPase [Steroidobacteraceae bacterium]|nr:AAA family ATPase [Steroidobacteraceae bacterium]